MNLSINIGTDANKPLNLFLGGAINYHKTGRQYAQGLPQVYTH